MAEFVSSKSKDPSTKVGCVIAGEDNEILSTGFNGFARGIDETIRSRWQRPDKYKWVIHAESNAIANAARVGVSLKGSTLYMNYTPKDTLCDTCAPLIIQAGIVKIVGPNIDFPGNSTAPYDVVGIPNEMLTEAGLERIIVLNFTIH
jgi:dCMP deaminase